MNLVRISIQFVAVLVILVVAIGIARFWIASKPEPKKHAPEAYVPVVTVASVQRGAFGLDLVTQGTVIAAEEGILSAEVTGPIIALADQLQAGHLIQKGDELLRIENSAYRRAVAQAEAKLAASRLALVQEQARAKRAAEEWQALDVGEATPLTLREPHLASAQVTVQADRSSLERARYELDRCVLKSPWRARVVSEQVSLGTWITPGRELARLERSDAVDVEIPLSLPQALQMGLKPGSGALVDAPMVDVVDSKQQRRWHGRIHRTAARLNERNRMLLVVARLEGEAGSLPMVGEFVETRIAGPKQADVLQIPTGALRGDDSVWLFEPEEGRLGRIRSVPLTILRRRDDYALATGELPDGAQLLTRQVAGASDGLTVRLPGKDMP